MDGRRNPPWPDVLRAEHVGQHRETDGSQLIVSGRHKYVRFSPTGDEHLFDLVDDPNEDHDLTPEADLDPWRQRLAQELADRSEGFSQAGSLVVARPHGKSVPVKQ